jgi:hypothetical protein
MNRFFLVGLVLVSLFAPNASAVTENGVVRYKYIAAENNNANGAFSTTFTLPTSPFNTPQDGPFDLIRTRDWWEFDATYTAPQSGSTGTQTFTLQIDGATTAVPGCAWSVTRGAQAIGNLVVSESNFHVECNHGGTLSPGAHTVQVAISGTTITSAHRSSLAYHVQYEFSVNRMTPFEEAVGLTALEFSAMIVLVVLGLMVNARGRDFGSKSAGAILLLVVGLVGLTIRNLWVGGLEFAIFVLLLSGYAFVRAAIDFVEERRARPKKTDPGAI